MSGIDRLVAESRRRVTRVDPRRAKQIVDAGGLLVDIRPAGQRSVFGEIPGALVIERNVLEWRLDPEDHNHLPEADDPHRPVVVMLSLIHIW